VERTSVSPHFGEPPATAKVNPVLDSAQLRAAGGPLRRTKFRAGYDVDEVDALLRRLEAAMDEQRRGGPSSLTPDAVLNVKFTATKFRDGYDQDEVDDLLDKVIARLKTTTSRGARSPLAAGSAIPDPDSAGMPATVSAHARARRFAAQTVLVLCGFGLIVTGVAVGTYPGDTALHQLALHLRDHGEPATVTHVTVTPSSRYESGSVVITYVVGGETTTTEVAGADADSVSEDPAALHVRYLPEAPAQVMSEDDIPYYADDALPSSRVAMIIGLIPTLLLTALWFARGRPPWSRWLYKAPKRRSPSQ
jgi:DivIVA domain-containing protein